MDKQYLAANMTYFAEDGSFGSAESLTIVDTSEWSEDDWDFVGMVSDQNRPYFAAKVTEKKEWAKNHVQD